jgi:hypothetical protein
MKAGIIVYALLATALTGCGGGVEEETVVDAHAMAQLHEVLSRQPNLPDGFSARPEQAWRMPFGQVGRDCRAVLESAGGHAPKEALTAQAAVSYEGDGLGERAGVGMARYAGEEAEEHLDALADALESCQEIHTSSGTDLRAREMSVEDVGDEAVGARLRGRLNGYPYTMDVVLSRVGDTLVSVVHAGMTDVNPDRTRRLVDAVLPMASA